MAKKIAEFLKENGADAKVVINAGSAGELDLVSVFFIKTSDPDKKFMDAFVASTNVSAEHSKSFMDGSQPIYVKQDDLHKFISAIMGIEITKDTKSSVFNYGTVKFRDGNSDIIRWGW